MGTQGFNTKAFLAAITKNGEIVDYVEVEGWARGWLIVHKSIDPDTWEAREDSWQVTQTITGLSVIPIDFATFYDAKRVCDALVESDMNWEVTPDLSEFETSEVRGYRFPRTGLLGSWVNT